MKNNKELVFSLIGLAGFIILGLGSDGKPPSKAKGQVSNVRCEHDTRVINGDLDYGVSVTLTAKNVGEPGNITIVPRLSTSEGEWDREQSLSFGAGEARTLTYFFHEPTINATNIQCRAKAFP